MAVLVRVSFDRQLVLLAEKVLQMGSLARGGVARAIVALDQADVDVAREVISEDLEINRRRLQLEEECYGLIATEQPVAGDLRVIVAALSISNELERIGDHGKKIAKVVLRLVETPRPIFCGCIPNMAQVSTAMLDRALFALTNRDVPEARRICKADDQVDALYNQTCTVLVSYMAEHPSTIAASTHMLQVAHELERVGDRATNIAERVIFAVTGELTDLNF
jgi:phosphate transport system protein